MKVRTGKLPSKFCLTRRHSGKRASAKRSILVATAVGLVAGCATPEPGWYVEPSLPQEETALLYARRPEAYYVFGVSGVEVYKIDGLRAYLNNLLSWGVVRISPGHHHIDAYYFQSIPFNEINATVSFAVELEKGRSYSIRGRSDDDQVQMWIEDTTTGRVAGIGTVARGKD